MAFVKARQALEAMAAKAEAMAALGREAPEEGGLGGRSP